MVSLLPKGNWTNTDAICGYNFDMEVKMPTMYYSKRVSQTQTVTDTRAYLQLCMLLLDAYNLIIDRQGYDSYELLVEQTLF